MIVIANLFPKLQTVKDLAKPLYKKPRFRTPFDSQHVEGYQTLAKSASEHFYQIFSSLLQKFIWKISPLVIYKILGMFGNTLNANGKYRIQDCKNCRSQFKCNYRKN